MASHVVHQTLLDAVSKMNNHLKIRFGDFARYARDVNYWNALHHAYGRFPNASFRDRATAQSSVHNILGSLRMTTDAALTSAKTRVDNNLRNKTFKLDATFTMYENAAKTGLSQAQLVDVFPYIVSRYIRDKRAKAGSDQYLTNLIDTSSVLCGFLVANHIARAYQQLSDRTTLDARCPTLSPDCVTRMNNATAWTTTLSKLLEWDQASKDAEARFREVDGLSKTNIDNKAKIGQQLRTLDAQQSTLHATLAAEARVQRQSVRVRVSSWVWFSWMLALTLAVIACVWLAQPLPVIALASLSIVALLITAFFGL